MLQKLRDQTQSLFFKVLVGAIIFVLAIFGFGAFNLFLNTDPAVASVNGEDITQNDLAMEAERERRRLAAQFGENFDPNLIDPIMLQNSVINQLISRMLLSQAAEDLGVGASDKQINEIVISNPNFLIDGQFEENTYRRVVNMLGYTPREFLALTGELIAVEQLRNGVLETAITTNDAYAPKGINYRMNPKNVRCLTALKVDCCVLGNNHVLDWGEAGCVETLDVLGEAGILTAGAGRTTAQATAPAVLQTKRGRVLVFSFGSTTSGIPRSWGATSTRPGINLVTDLCESTARTIGAQIRARRDRKDIVVASIHWGGNWGYEVPPGQRAFAHALIDEAGVDIVHGHSSHHPKGIELHHGKPVLYGCGDFINDYEGISGHGAYRGDLSLMYFVAMNRDTGRLERLEMVPMKMKRFRLHRATREDAEWLRDTLAREGQKLGTGVTLTNEGTLEIT